MLEMEDMTDAQIGAQTALINLKTETFKLHSLKQTLDDCGTQLNEPLFLAKTDTLLRNVQNIHTACQKLQKETSNANDAIKSLDSSVVKITGQLMSTVNARIHNEEARTRSLDFHRFEVGSVYKGLL